MSRSMRADLDLQMDCLRAHPAFDHCFRIYRNALRDWHASGAIQSAAATLGMDRRAYSDSRLLANQFSWVASDTTGNFTPQHQELAWLDAVEESDANTSNSPSSPTTREQP